MRLQELLIIVIAAVLSIASAIDASWLYQRHFFRRILMRDANLTLEDQGSGEIIIRRAIGVRKMSIDESEMFFPHYWTTEIRDSGAPEEASAFRASLEGPRQSDLDNVTALQPLQAPLSLHERILEYEDSQYLLRHLLARSRQKRDFQCPTNTNACTAINRPNTCCPVDETCQLINDVGSGDVGCCPQGSGNCGGEVSGCQQGYTSCPGTQGGGCCVPGYSCAGTGCVMNSTATVTVNPTITRSPSTSSTSPLLPLSADSTSTFTVATTQLFTVTGVPSPVSSSSSSTSSPSTPVSLSERSSTPSTTPSAILPIRPTSNIESSTTTTRSTIIPTQCPTGFYQCSAFENPGCCRIGRDCAQSSCPTAATTQFLSSNGVNVGGVAAAPTGLGENGCALGWFSCASAGGNAAAGGGCCPSGYACGASCTATNVLLAGGATGTAKVAKDNGGGGSIRGVAIATPAVLWLCGFLAMEILFV